MSGDPKVNLELENFSNLGFIPTKFNDISMMEFNIRSWKNLAAIIVPSLLFDNGLKILSKEYYYRLRDLCY